MKVIDFSLTSFDYGNDIWLPIHDVDGHKTIADLNFPPDTILNIERVEKANTNIQNISKTRHEDLTLKLCKRPMNKIDLEYLYVNSSISIGQLKEEARKRVRNQRTKNLYLWMENGWIKFETDLDDLTLAEMEFDQYSMISFETEDDLIPGLCGLTNLGNTCFMNSALQCLSNIPELTRKILSFGNEINAPIIGAYSTLIKTMWSGEHVVTIPSSLLLNISENLPRFRRYRQQDAQEFMNYFLHLIHQELTSERTLITDLFYGRIQSSVKCLGGCHSIETNEEVISFLPLPVANDIDEYNILYLQSNGKQKLVSVRACARTIETLIESFIKQYEPKLSSTQIQAYNNHLSSINPSLNSLLVDFFREEPLNGDYYCSKCLDLKTARQKADLVLPLPPVLIIQLKRFTYDLDSSAKIDTYIDFPLRDLDLGQYIIQNNDEKTNVSTLYDLVAVSNHTGSLVAGHYITYARNDRNKKWYSFNDETIREIIDEHDIVTKNAYILVYIQRTTL
ncbi:unnamed protein product [Rotaria sordida]|nr:unnamed protein product [Rotaria sordida]